MRQAGLFDPEEPPSFVSQRAETSGDFVPLSALAPAASGPARTGIARMAAEAEELDFRNDVEYRDIACRSLLSPCNSDRVPFAYTINPYRGCEIGCTYCYARYTHEFMELEDWLDFERKIFVKRGAREALVEDLRRRDTRGKWIAIGASTDPYQPAERRYGLTRSILALLAERRGLLLSVTTKSDLVARDADLLARIGKYNELQVNVTITTPHHALSRKTEPRAPRPDRRLAAVKTLTEAGVKAGVFVMPVLPRINDGLEDLELLVRLAKEAGAGYLAAQPLYLRKSSRKRFFPFLEEQFPELLPYYRRLYGPQGGEELRTYSRRIAGDIQRLKTQYGLPTQRWAAADFEAPDEQLALF